MKFRSTSLQLLLGFLILPSQIAFASPGGDTLSYLFESGNEGYKCFRIPAIVTTGNGTLLAFSEGRKNGCSDTGDIDLVMKRSMDNGLTWSELLVVWDDGDNVCGNPTPVVDEVTGVVHLLSTWNLGEDTEHQIIDGTSKDTRRVFMIRSEDDGKSWSKAEDITKAVKKETWSWYATGPCHGIQLESSDNQGRLLVPCDHIEAGTKRYFSHVIYSDDHGETWKLGGTTPQDQVNECTVAELPNGRVMLNMRNYDRTQKSRKISFSEDGGMSWGDIVSDPSLIEPVCQASLLMSGEDEDGNRTLLFLNPAHESERCMMTLRSSKDGGLNWEGSLLLHRGPAAYSDMTMLLDGAVGCLYEAGNSSPYQGIVFQHIPMPDLK